MPTEIITGLNGGVALTAPAAGDTIPITDVSDTTEAATGTTKPIVLADLLKIIFQDFALSGDISPAQITANQDDYNPTGLADASVLRLSTDASRNITSIAGGADGRVLLILNVGSFNIVLKDDDGATGTAGNRFAFSGDVTLAGDQGAIIWYDSTSSRWRIFATSAALGGAPTGSAGGDLTGTYPNPRVAQINDANGNELLKFGTTASAVNEVTITNKATGTGPTIEATGGDTNINLNLVPKGTGELQYNGTEVGFRHIPQNSQSANYTTVLTDRGKHIYHPTSDDNPRTFTIDSNANVAYPIGTAITFVNDQNTVTIAITSDTLVWAEDGSTGSRTLAENGIATAIKVTSTRWIISGTGLS